MEQRSRTERPLIERLARHLAALEPDAWQARVEDAASILAILKEPDAALRARWDVSSTGARHDDDHAAGADEEGEIALTPQAVSHDRADWTHVHGQQERSS